MITSLVAGVMCFLPLGAGENPNVPSIGGELTHFSQSSSLGAFKLNGVLASVQNGEIHVTFQKGNQYPNLAFPIPEGGWNLETFGGIQIKVRNPGRETVQVHLRVDNPGDWKDSPWNTHDMPVAAGETQTLGGLFGTNNGSPGFNLDPRRVSAIQVFMVSPDKDVELVFSDLKAYGSPGDRADAAAMSQPEDRDKPVSVPPWLGKKPPVEGDWVQTLDENFDGNALDSGRWTPRFPWNGPMPGHLERYCPENVVVGGGVARFVAEKRRGHENNDPNLGERDYSSGLIVSYDKWTQLYGYFEARIHLPKARGLWPAFWMMPDRGPGAQDRRNTGDHGMEFDIMEILSEWGPGRSNAAVHWDGYGPEHKSWGTSHIYFGPTPDGWHHFGLLWEPGKLTWYVDGTRKAVWANERVGSVPEYLKLNVQMGGWATSDVDLAALPDAMLVDFVRAWQLKARIKK